MSLSWRVMANAVRTRLKVEIADAVGVQVIYDNDGTPSTPNSTRWIRATILPGEAVQASLGTKTNKRYRTPGVLMVQIFVPAGKGDASALELADLVKIAFRCVSAGGVTYKTPYHTVIGKIGSEWQVNVTCPFYADDVA